MSGVTTKSVSAIRTEDSDGVRMAVVRCPWCGAEHSHVVPRDMVVGARIERSPKCDARKGVYLVVLPQAIGAP